MTYFSKAFGANAQHGVDAAQTALTQTEAAKAQAETKAQEGANEQYELDEEWLAQLNGRPLWPPVRVQFCSLVLRVVETCQRIKGRSVNWQPKRLREIS